eukprot:SAG11_NODE_14731_length_601_cov_4.067729_1_plen_45_part_01
MYASIADMAMARRPDGEPVEWTCEEVAEWVLTLADQLGAESAAGV